MGMQGKDWKFDRSSYKIQMEFERMKRTSNSKAVLEQHTSFLSHLFSPISYFSLALSLFLFLYSCLGVYEHRPDKIMRSRSLCKKRGGPAWIEGVLPPASTDCLFLDRTVLSKSNGGSLCVESSQSAREIEIFFFCMNLHTGFITKLPNHVGDGTGFRLITFNLLAL